MMRKRSFTRAGLAVLVLLSAAALFNCSALFDFNLYGDLDPVPAPQAADYEGSDGLDDLDGDLDSPATVEALAGDPETVNAIEDLLEQEYLNDGVTTAEDQQAAIVYADLNLETSNGDDLVNNIFTIVLEGVDPSTQTVSDILGQIIPAEAAASPEAFTAMILGLLDANGAYVLLGNSITDVNGNSIIDAGEGVPPEANMGDVAQKAVVAYMVNYIVGGIMVSSSCTQADAVGQLYLLLCDPDSTELTITDSAAPNPFVDVGQEYLMNIFGAAGLPFEAAMVGGA